MNLHNPRCFNNHMGLWLAEPMWMAQTVAAIKSGLMAARSLEKQAERVGAEAPPENEVTDGKYGPLLYKREAGVAVVRMIGPMMKAESKYGGASTVLVRKALRTAAQDNEVSSIMLVIDSPGGSVAGTEELGRDIKMADSKKPVIAFIEDQCCSAALWAASQTRRIVANSTALVGSIGTIVVIEDTSKQAAMQGVEVHVISTGPFKGAFAPGTKVTPEQLAYLQGIVDGTNEFFKDAIVQGRGMSKSEVNAIADGRVFLAEEAKKLHLIDAVMAFDDAFTSTSEKYGVKKKSMTMETDMADKLLNLSPI